MDTLKTMMEVFTKEMNINQLTEDGETLLHLLAKQGEHEHIENLVEYGIDLSIKDDTGNTFLHDLVEQAGDDPDNSVNMFYSFNKKGQYFKSINKVTLYTLRQIHDKQVL